METFKSDQEKFWAGEFGDSYIERNSSDKLFFSKVSMWGRMLQRVPKLDSMIELGCNIGLNLIAVKHLNPLVQATGVEINAQAAQIAEEKGVDQVHQASILDDLSFIDPVDLVACVTVLIHQSPYHLSKAYENIVNLSNRYILIAEYYNPTPVSVVYRGNEDRLFKRDFAGDLIDKYGLYLVDYGFFYKRDNIAPQDDITFFLLEKPLKRP